MNKKYQYIVTICVIVLVSGIALVLINPSWKVEELLWDFEEDMGTATGIISTTGGLTPFNKGDRVKIEIFVEGDPVDFYIWGYFPNGTSREVIRWKDIEGVGGMFFWNSPEDGNYTLNFRVHGDWSEVHALIYREYTKHLLP